MRELIESARYKPLVARYKVFIIDEVHMLSKSAFNALLKTLEEPPEHVKFIFATTEIRKVPVTVLSRCQRFDLRRVDVPELAAHFKKIVANENAKAADDALAMIARAAEGSVRDGLSLLDQAIAMGEGEVSAPTVRSMLGLADRGRIFDLLENVFARRHQGGDRRARRPAQGRRGARAGAGRSRRGGARRRALQGGRSRSRRGSHERRGAPPRGGARLAPLRCRSWRAPGRCCSRVGRRRARRQILALPPRWF